MTAAYLVAGLLLAVVLVLLDIAGQLHLHTEAAVPLAAHYDFRAPVVHGGAAPHALGRAA